LEGVSEQLPWRRAEASLILQDFPLVTAARLGHRMPERGGGGGDLSVAYDIWLMFNQN